MKPKILTTKSLYFLVIPYCSYLFFVATAAGTGLAVPQLPLQLTNLRIEGVTSTIYEAPILSSPRFITTASGGTHLCDGTNYGANLYSGNTPTDALDAASQIADFTYDAIWQAQFDDFFIMQIADSAETATQS
ncbi:MAG: hypothetical protein MMC33_009878 [Icmadophila ericetorum]|nr:hypothetical protein [Icmadophila ericetorum]